MQTIYNLFVSFISFVLPITKYFNPKMKLFVNGREDIFTILASKINPQDQVIWIHCASLGEFEQARPIIDALKSQFTNHKILLTFFSPSGFEIRKNYKNADIITYLPLDTYANAQKFVALTNPILAIFVKYEFWWNHLDALKKKKINTLLISGIFRENQLFFKRFFRWYQTLLHAFTHFFVQDDNSKRLLQNIGFSNTTVSGDTRFDSVESLIIEQKEIPYFKTFCDEKLVIVFGSSWQHDLAIYIDFINKHPEYRYIIAPHNIQPIEIEKHRKNITISSVLQTDLTQENAKDFHVIIMNTMGWLSSAYAYADIAYVGGGFGKGIHNLLEAATHGIPILFGPNHQKFNEASDLKELGAGIAVNNKDEFEKTIGILLQDQIARKEKGNLAKQYIEDNIGATKIILGYIKDVL